MIRKLILFGLFPVIFLTFSLVLAVSDPDSFQSDSTQSVQVKPSDYGLKEGDLISAIFSDDPDVYIINEHGYKRVFLNPEIFNFYQHLGGFFNIKLVTQEVRDSFPTSGLFRNCENNDQKVYGVDIEGEDEGQLQWVNTSGDQAVQDDPDFFKKVFCINRKEFNWYPKSQTILNTVKDVPKYDRMKEAIAVSTEKKLEAKTELKNIGQVIICHYPSDNPANSQTLTIDVSALKAHLDHGDTVGACFAVTPTPVASFSPSPIASPSYTPIVTVSPIPTASASFSPTPIPTVTTIPTVSTAPTTPISNSNPIPVPISSTSNCTGGEGRISGLPTCLMPENLLPTGSNSTWNEVDNSTGKVLNVVVCNVAVCGRSGEWRKTGHPANSTYIQTPFNGGYWGQYYTNGVWKTNDGGIIQPGSNQIISSTETYTPPVSSYNTRPVISSVAVSSITSNSAVISWVTDVPATGLVNYGSTPTNWIVTPENTSLTTQHSFTLTNLATNSLYNYRVYSHNAYGDQTDLVNGLPPNRTFTTLSGSASCSGIGLTLNDGKTTYIKGVDNFVNYTWTCAPSGSADVNIGIQKPIYGWISLNTTANSSTKTLSINISGDDYPVGAYRLEACFDTCGSIVAGTTFSISSPTPTPTPTQPITLQGNDGTWCYDADEKTPVPDSSYYGSLGSAYIKSYCKDQNGTYYDYCESSNVVRDWYCTGTWSGVMNNVRCAAGGYDFSYNGYACSDGALVKSTPTPTPTTGSTSYDFTRDLYFGLRGDDVVRLQALLVNEVNYSANLLTGYFGDITREAVKKLQEKLDVKPVSGYFGVITRQALKSLVSN